MKCTELILSRAQPLHFGGKRLAIIERRETGNRIDGMLVTFDNGQRMELDAAVDVSEQLKHPRVFIVEGLPVDEFLIFGGQKTYWISIGGSVKREVPLFRRWGEEEFWTTTIVECPAGLLFVYEAGVMMVTHSLELGWHVPKLLNDDFVALEENRLKFLRDNGDEWFLRLDDGIPC